MTLTFELDLDRSKLSRHAEYLGKRSYRLKVTVRTNRHTQTDRQTKIPSACFILTTKTVGNNAMLDAYVTYF